MANKLITSAMFDEVRVEHYGVKGMKWGVRRTPEQLGHRSRKSEIEKSESNQKINGLEVYLLGLGVSLIIVSKEVKLIVEGVRYAASNVGNEKVMKIVDDENLKITKLKDVKKIEPPETLQQSLKNVNNTRSINKNFKNNCPNTTMGYELRRRGYDVKAKPSPSGEYLYDIKKSYNIKESDVFKIKNLNDFRNNKLNNKKINDYFDSVPDGYRGAVQVTWASMGAGHIFNVEKTNGKIIFIDAQSGRSGEFKGLNFLADTAKKTADGLLFTKFSSNPSNYLYNASSVEIFRIDNAQINDEEISKRLLKG